MFKKKEYGTWSKLLLWVVLNHSEWYHFPAAKVALTTAMNSKTKYVLSAVQIYVFHIFSPPLKKLFSSRGYWKRLTFIGNKSQAFPISPWRKQFLHWREYMKDIYLHCWENIFGFRVHRSGERYFSGSEMIPEESVEAWIFQAFISLLLRQRSENITVSSMLEIFPKLPNNKYEYRRSSCF